MNKIVVMAALAGAMVSTAAMAQNRTGARLIDGNVNFDVGGTPTSTTAIPSTNTSGASSFTSNLRVNNATAPTSGIDNSFTTWWWVRAGNDTREFALANPTSRTVSGDGRSATYTFNQSGLTWTMTFVAQSLGADSGQVLSSLTATNNGSTAVSNVNMFWYVDSFLFGQDGNDRVSSVETTGDRRINIIDTATAAAGWSAQVAGFGATGLGAGTFGVVGGQMGDTGIDNFADVVAPPGTDTDLSHVMQWTVPEIAAGGSLTVFGAYAVAASGAPVQAIPAPGVAGLLAIGGLMVARRRRGA